MIRWGLNGKSGRVRVDAPRVLASVRELSWEGYWSLVADIFRRCGHVVFAGEGPDRDVIDMELHPREIGGPAEISRGAAEPGSGHWLIVNCQLRGMSHISTAPLEEMAMVAARNGAGGVLLITDGDFSPEAHSFADDHSLILVDGQELLGLVLELTLGDERDRKLASRLSRLISKGRSN